MDRQCIVTIACLTLVCAVGASSADAGFAGTDLILPAVGSGAGVPPSVWYTTVWIHNPGVAPASITVSLLGRESSLDPMVFTDTVAPGETTRYDDAVRLMFAEDTFGALRITSDERVVASSRIYSQEGSAVAESRGQLFTAVPASLRDRRW